MNAIATVSQHPAKAVLSECSPALKGLLAPNQSFFFAVDELRRTPAIHDEAKTVLSRLSAVNQPAPPQEIIASLAPLVAVYGVQDKSEQEWASFWKVYIEDLSAFPRWVIEAAVRTYRRQKDAEWFPRPGPLRALCEEEYRPSCAAHSRLTRAFDNPSGKAA